jgi:hypothetical protein
MIILVVIVQDNQLHQIVYDFVDIEYATFNI